MMGFFDRAKEILHEKAGIASHVGTFRSQEEWEEVKELLDDHGIEYHSGGWGDTISVYVTHPEEREFVRGLIHSYLEDPSE